MTRDPNIPWMTLGEQPEGFDVADQPDALPDDVVLASRLNRRGFLQALGIGSGVATLAACERLPARKAMPYLIAPEEITPGVPVKYASTCSGCAAACGLMVTARDGRPIKLEGHADHALSRQGLCAVGQAELRSLYDSERLQKPTVGGAASTWEAVDSLVRAELSDGVWVVTPTLTSPTARATVRDFVGTRGRWLEWDPDPQSLAPALDACGQVYGVRALPWLDFERADVVALIGADLLGAGHDPVVHTRSYAARKKRHGEGPSLRHVQLEGNLTLTGAAADERLQMHAGERADAAVWLAHRLAALTGGDSGGLPAAPAKAPQQARLESLARELAGARSRAIVWSGGTSAREQLAVAHCNRLLGNVGTTLDTRRPSLVRRSDATALADFRAAVKSGAAKAVIFAGVDPVQDLADGDALAAQLAKVPLTIAIAERANATTAACRVVAAAHHGLESWGDAMPRPGVLTVQQPTVRPIFGTRSAWSNLLAWSGAANTDYRAHLMASWRGAVFGQRAYLGAFDAWWNESVRAGHAPDAWQRAATPGWFGDDVLTATPAAPAPATEAAAGGVFVEAVADTGIRDARTAQNPWLRELPDPLTRVSWTPAARLAPRRAKELGVKDGDVLALTVGARTVELAARILPGQHPDVIGVPVGYGPRVADGAVDLRATGKHTELPLQQWHSFTEGRPIVHQVARPDQSPPAGHQARPTPYPGREIGSPAWHMVIDLDACTGCSACIIACQAENNVPVVGPDEIRNHRDMFWLRMDRYFVGDEDDPDVLFEPMMCSHCDSAPCENVCPVAATVHSIDGLNMQAYNRCVGTRYCANNCPYKVRRFNWFEYEHGGPVERLVLNPDVVVRERGVMEKCSFCVQRIQLGRIEGKNAGDRSVPDVRTACQQSCPADAIRFGDAANPDSEISALRAQPRAFQVLAEIGTRPSVTYLAHVRNRASEDKGK